MTDKKTQRPRGTGGLRLVGELDSRSRLRISKLRPSSRSSVAGR